MKQKLSTRNYFSVLIILITLLFPVLGDFNFASIAQAKNSTSNNYIESEVVAKISPDANADALAAKYNLTIELLKTSSDGNLYILKSRDAINRVSTF